MSEYSKPLITPDKRMQIRIDQDLAAITTKEAGLARLAQVTINIQIEDTLERQYNIALSHPLRMKIVELQGTEEEIAEVINTANKL